MKIAIITGVGGQDGSYLAEKLVEEGYRVIGTSRCKEMLKGHPVLTKLPGLELVDLNLGDMGQIKDLLRQTVATEVFNMAAFSTGAGMWDNSREIAEINGLAVVSWLEAIREASPFTRFCQASSSEMYGNAKMAPQDESTSFHPRSPYGASKLFAHHLVGQYRERFALHVSSAILFNHESPRRSVNFITRKVTKAVAEIYLGRRETLELGNLSARRDWGFAGEYADAMALMARQDSPADYVVSTGMLHSVRELCECAFGYVGLDYRNYVRTSTEHYREELETPLVGNSRRIERALGWRAKVGFKDLIADMVSKDLERLGTEDDRTS